MERNVGTNRPRKRGIAKRARHSQSPNGDVSFWRDLKNRPGRCHFLMRALDDSLTNHPLSSVAGAGVALPESHQTLIQFTLQYTLYMLTPPPSLPPPTPKRYGGVQREARPTHPSAIRHCRDVHHGAGTPSWRGAILGSLCPPSGKMVCLSSS